MKSRENKVFFIPSEKLIEILPNEIGGGFATDMIMVDGDIIRYMYRENPDDKYDSGWRFFSGKESQEYVDDPNNTSFYKLNTIANYDQSIISYLNLPIGTELERIEDTNLFEII